MKYKGNIRIPDKRDFKSRKCKKNFDSLKELEKQFESEDILSIEKFRDQFEILFLNNSDE